MDVLQGQPIDSRPSSPPYCRATLKYSGGTGDAEGVPVEEDIRDGRLAGDRLGGWQGCGFQLLSHVSAFSGAPLHDWANKQTAYDEIGALARSLTGCDAAILDPAVPRSREAGKRDPDLAPVRVAHSDYTENYRAMIQNPDHPYHRVMAPSMARLGLTTEDIVNAKRVVTLQFWRSVGPVNPDYPLAVCDARSVPRDALQLVHLASFADVATEYDVFMLRAPREIGQYHWYTFPRMTTDEVLVWRSYDSRCVELGKPFWTPHAAFRDPTVGADAPGRMSVEYRATCLSMG